MKLSLDPLDLVSVLEDIKAQNIQSFSIPCKSYADIVIICTALSSRHLQAIADKIIKNVKPSKSIRGVEGQKQPSDWILIDLGSIIIHIMLVSARELYNLEELFI